MRLLISFLFAFIATAAAFPELHFFEARKHGNETSKGGEKKNSTANSVNKQCRQISKIVRLTELAANQTKLDALVSKGKLNATEVQVIKDKAANATTTLKTLQANTTLVDECNVIAANRHVKEQCFAMKRLAETAALANNTTAMDAFITKKKLNDSQVTKFKEQISKAQTKLQALQSNSTLTDLCSQQKSQKGEENSGSSTTGAATDSASPTPRQATSAANPLTLQTVPYIFVPALAGVFALLL
ncbi:hypothetical protein PMIN02_005672 [Paraphaeosphaeria minitans]|uniref:Uncharacterized protein n=1 Tax=Paraphaeosphaeria minitans TaxID=565426 RepID=A0A9P6GV50_9PLEO|nr:hypothetical protein PMIN01_01362 [Paraphaeosphaeria minitans]